MLSAAVRFSLHPVALVDGSFERLWPDNFTISKQNDVIQFLGPFVWSLEFVMKKDDLRLKALRLLCLSIGHILAVKCEADRYKACDLSTQCVRASMFPKPKKTKRMGAAPFFPTASNKHLTTQPVMCELGGTLKGHPRRHSTT